MRTLITIILMFSSLAVAGEGNIYPIDLGERNFIAYSVNNSSWLSLSGTTNVNTFECLSNGDNTNGFIMTDVTVEEGRIKFTDATISLNVNSFDCKNPLITRDMYKALGGGKDSKIEIRLLDAKPGEMVWYPSSGSILANVLITINGSSKKTELNISWQQTDGFEFEFEGTTDLSMSDFGIDPPSPALGLVRVDDKITVNFNYNVQTSVISRLD
jgi:hypothetical protein